MSSNKRMIYIWDENVKFYDNLNNKSDLINTYLLKLQENVEIKEETELDKKLKRINGRTE